MYYIGIDLGTSAVKLLLVDEKGNIIDGDHMLVMCAKEMIANGTLKDNAVVTTVMANIGFHKAVKELGGKAEITKVGDRYVLENMLANGYNLGGEQSGHIIFSDFSTTGDGPVTALQTLASIKRSGKKASELNELMVSYPQLLVNVMVKTKEGWEENKAIAEATKAGEAELGGDATTQLTGRGFWHSNASRDNRWAAGDTFAGNVWLIDINTGHRYLMATDTRMRPDHAHPFFSPDGKYLYFQSGHFTNGQRLNLMRMETESVFK